MNEHSFIKAIHRKLPANVYRWKIHDTFAGGVPDAMYMDKRQVWIEYKYVKELPVKDTTIVRTTIAPLQIAWLNRLNASGGKAVVVIGCKNCCVVQEDNFHAHITKAEFTQKCIPIALLVDWIQGATGNA